jgi:hypothetical protein
MKEKNPSRVSVIVVRVGFYFLRYGVIKSIFMSAYLEGALAA